MVSDRWPRVWAPGLGFGLKSLGIAVRACN